MYSLAARLGKTLSEIEAMNRDEFIGWLAYFEIAKEQE